MSDNEKTTSVIGIVLSFAITLLLIQSCMYSRNASEFHDDDIVRIGRKRLIVKFNEPSAVKILKDVVIRPGLNGSEFGYWVQYQRLTADGEWVMETHYDE